MDQRITFNDVLLVVRKMLLLNGIVLLLMSLHRAGIFAFFGNRQELAGQWSSLAKAFFLGIRFDAAVLAYISAPVTLSLLLVWSLRREKYLAPYLAFLKCYYLILLSLLFYILFVDFGYFGYFKSHINILIFGVIEDDTRALMSTIWDSYNIPLIASGFIAFTVLLFWMIRSVLRTGPGGQAPSRRYPAAFKAVFVFLLLAANFLCARGSLGMFPLGMTDAGFSSNMFINKLSLNGVFTLQEALEFRSQENKDYDIESVTGYKGRIADAIVDLTGVDRSAVDAQNPAKNLIKRTGMNPAAERVRPNVIVIMMEGFGSELGLHDSPTFRVLGELRKHFDEDYVFYNFLSGDIGTIGSLESVMMSVPKRPGMKSIFQSKYAFKRHPSGAALPFQRAGYETVFMYGGNLGWRSAQTFIPLQGFDTLEGDGAMDPAYPRNQWGVYDEFLFDHIFKKLKGDPGKPKFIFALTTTNHPPYSVPATYVPQPQVIPKEIEGIISGDRKLAAKRFLTYQYANQKLGEFISRIKGSEFRENTIIAVTGDHNFWDVFNYNSGRCLDVYGVPFYLYVPAELRPGSVDTRTFGSHIDIMPTVYGLALSGRSYASVGVNMLDPGAPHMAMNVDGMLLNADGATQCLISKNYEQFYSWDPRDPRTMVSRPRQAQDDARIKRYKAALAAADYLITHPFDLP